ncbi:MAG: tRNA (guanosine(37)-N1)-methyltransferase TrmD [Patescibacteria group bacterium]|nr:tRNA (guanosine(37)-N1)-methyltransferase TrmD [Patescibacteria group bacterium]
MTFHIITIFPKIFDSYFNESILKRARTNKLIDIKIHNLRDWTTDRHKTVDDTPFGGGAGMVMKIEPLYKALQSIPLFNKGGKGNLKTKTILLSAKGKTWNQKLAKSHSKLNDIILICGRYEGVDERITKFIDEEISIGDYVLTGGEIGAMAIIDSITRLLPGALGNADSAKNESHSVPGVLEHPQYTRPEIFTASGKSYRVPKVLISGNHKKIADWRAKKSKHIRPSSSRA